MFKMPQTATKTLLEIPIEIHSYPQENKPTRETDISISKLLVTSAVDN